MKIGPAIRRMMPPAVERRAAAAYRGVFVDLPKVAECLAEQLPPGARVLDIGGGDGDLLNHLLSRRSDINIAMVDVAARVGGLLHPRHLARVSLHPGTALEDHLQLHAGSYEAVLVSDVMHHLPQAYRPEFLRALHGGLAGAGSIFIKDIEPGHFIASLSLFCDKYISGDRGVVLISCEQLQAVASRVLPQHTSREVGLLREDRPNYLLRLDFETGVAGRQGRPAP